MAMPAKEKHGQYKTPGGKLVSVSVTAQDGWLTDLRLSGDFFLEPDSALSRIEAALVGCPEAEGPAAMAGRIEAALDPTDHLVGFDAGAVAIAVRRALGRSSTWADHGFELIQDGPRPPAMHMALDQVYAEELAAGRRGPTLRFWQWDQNAVVIGAYQSLSNEVDMEAATTMGVTVVRRVSGGGAMFVEPNNTITHSIVVPDTLVDGMSFVDSYAFLDAWVVGALRQLGIEATHQPINDIASPSGKIAGAAQKRYADGSVVHHVTMAYGIDHKKMMEVLRIGREKISDKGTVSAAKLIDPLRSQTTMTRSQVVEALKDHFARLYQLEASEPTPSELARAEHLVQTKFGTAAWLQRVP